MYTYVRVCICIKLPVHPRFVLIVLLAPYPPNPKLFYYFSFFFFTFFLHVFVKLPTGFSHNTTSVLRTYAITGPNPARRSYEYIVRIYLFARTFFIPLFHPTRRRIKGRRSRKAEDSALFLIREISILVELL